MGHGERDAGLRLLLVEIRGQLVAGAPPLAVQVFRRLDLDANSLCLLPFGTACILGRGDPGSCGQIARNLNRSVLSLLLPAAEGQEEADVSFPTHFADGLEIKRAAEVAAHYAVVNERTPPKGYA